MKNKVDNVFIFYHDIILIFYTPVINKRRYAINNYYRNKAKLPHAPNIKKNLIYINIIF